MFKCKWAGRTILHWCVKIVQVRPVTVLVSIPISESDQFLRNNKK